ncbi:hypothetical protein BJ138DRAFT_1131028 [Hygrophoropsis aurantiaca]|uniref:Uncharacterized protein n=1 Tax=Hygrophoropsis aurantiaca TaxID=72124 RepID=A0ACB7ZTL2_9AGAM|nr:hypothetical protein BJ138DRAFT_1131028 [Hygrophoropsis aurantiaca]
MTILYLIARYSGSLGLIGTAVRYMDIIWAYSVNVNLYLAVNWADNIFLLTMKAILAIRVYALFNRSKTVLIFLATFYCLQSTTVIVVAALLYNNRVAQDYFIFIGPFINDLPQTVVVNTSALFSSQDATMLSVVINAVGDTVLLFFALWALVRHALEAKSFNEGCSINVLVRTMAADHLMYFVCNLAWLSSSLAANYITGFYVSVSLVKNVLNVFNALAVVSGPRMVISLRKTENRTRHGGHDGTMTLDDELSTIRFGVREPSQVESVMEKGNGCQATDENVRID